MNVRSNLIRFGQLYAGLVLYGLSMALLVRARLGLDPWDVLNSALVRLTGLSFGTIVIIVGAVVLLLWIPLRLRPGLGTVSNVVVIGLVVDVFLAWIPPAHAWWLQGGLLVLGVVLNGVATGMYIGAKMGAGPRDGLMTGFVARYPRRSVRLVRTTIEVTVVVVGFLLGGSVGIATLVYAVCIGPLVHIFIPIFSARDSRSLTAVEVRH